MLRKESDKMFGEEGFFRNGCMVRATDGGVTLDESFYSFMKGKGDR